MKATLNFDLEDPQDKIELERALKAIDAFLVLREIQQQIFRPARKHGYSNKTLRDLVEGNDKAVELIGLLEDRFIELLQEYELDIDKFS
jgi:hypothetical protein